MVVADEPREEEEISRGGLERLRSTGDGHETLGVKLQVMAGC